MDILTRFEEIMSANINAMLDEAEEPAKMLDQYLRNIQNNLQNIKSEIATIMAEEKRCQRIIDKYNTEIKSLEEYAAKALEIGNEDDARVFLTKKNIMSQELPSLQELYENAKDNTQNIQKMYDKLSKDVEELERNIPMLKAKFAQAKLQGSIKQITESSISEDKADAMLELNKIADDGTDNLKNKYDTNTINSQVEEELARLKQNMNTDIN